MKKKKQFSRGKSNGNIKSTENNECNEKNEKNIIFYLPERKFSNEI